MIRLLNMSALYYIVPMLMFVALVLIIFLVRQKSMFSYFGHSSSSVWSVSYKKIIARCLLYLISAICICIAILRPVVLSHSFKVDEFKMNILIALDISDSMLSRDISPDRLTRSKLEISRLLDSISDIPIGLEIFSGEAFLQVPLTSDYSSIKALLSDINPDYISKKGTNFLDAMQVGVSGFTQINGYKKIMLLVTDGEDHGNAVDDIVRKCVESNVSIYVIGVGTSQGAPIPVLDDKGNAVDYKKDSFGNPVISKFNPNYLMLLSQKTGGRFYFVNNADYNLCEIVKQIQGLEKNKAQAELKQTNTKDIYYYFLFLGIVFLVFAYGLPVGLNSIAIIFCLLLANVGHCDEVFNGTSWMNNELGNYAFKRCNFDKAESCYIENAGKPNASIISHYNLGNLLYKNGRLADAQKEWEHVLKSKDKKEREYTFFNQGVASISGQDWDGATREFISALKNNPNDVDAKKNLELVALMKKQTASSQNKTKKSNTGKDNKSSSLNKERPMRSEIHDSQYTKEQAEQILNNYSNEKPLKPLSSKGVKYNGPDW